MPDSGDAALAGMIVGGALGYTVSDGTWQAAALGAGVGLVASGESFERVMAEPAAIESDCGCDH